MGDVKYITKNQLKMFLKEATMPIGDVDYCSLYCFDDIYYSTQVVWILDQGEHECDSNNGEYHTYSSKKLKKWLMLFNTR